ncbi:MAG TPA: hypothetical protein VGF17_21205 [Phytomonospora sp.]
MTRIEPNFDAMTEAEYAQWLYQNRDALHLTEPDRTFEVSDSASAVVSVRIPANELKAIEAAAKEAGLALSTYIRQAAVATAQAIDLDRARGDLARLRTVVAALESHLGAA